jgi:hypothetical protein
MDFSKIKCSEFIGPPKGEVGSILMWIEGFYTGQNALLVMYQDEAMKDFKALAEILLLERKRRFDQCDWRCNESLIGNGDKRSAGRRRFCR